MSSCSCRTSSVSASLRNDGIRLTISGNRLFEDYSRGGVADVHEHSSQVLHGRLRHLLSPRRGRWHGRSRSRPNEQVWRRPRHGHRPVRQLYPSVLHTVLTYCDPSCTTSCLLCFLASAYTQWALLFQFLITLDFSSHYIHMYAYVDLLTHRTRFQRAHSVILTQIARFWFGIS